MNELSWLIYAADVADMIKSLSGAVLIGLVILAVVLFIGGAANLSEAKYEKDEAAARARAMERMASWKKTAPYAAACALVLAFVPSAGTLYAIAASEVGEKVIASETGEKAIKALNAWLDKQIAKQ